ncbi:MAG: ketopantoate reductase family protein [Ardenticatenaceae bacterium]|nr:ketopantoate reductase family protein [Ardenticatenaceae bacterium]
MSRILIYGAGAVGSYTGGLLARAGHQVLLVSRSGADRIQQRGVTIIGADGPFTVHPAAVMSLRQAMLQADKEGPFDYMILAMKSYDLDDAINEMAAFCPDPPVMVTLQNGIGVEKPLGDQFGYERLVAGTLTTPVSYDQDLNLVEERSDRGYGFASPSGGKLHRKIGKIFQDAEIEAAAYKNYEGMKWSKALINMIGNATAAIVNRPPDVLYKFKPLYELEMRMLQEAMKVMKARRIPVINLPGAPTKQLQTAMKWLPQSMLYELLKRQVAKGRGSKMPSFQIDLSAGKKKNEVIYHNGAVDRLGREAGVPAPVNRALTDILLQIAYEEVSWERYNGQPKQLLADVNAHIRQQKEQSS